MKYPMLVVLLALGAVQTTASDSFHESSSLPDQDIPTDLESGRRDVPASDNLASVLHSSHIIRRGMGAELHVAQNLGADLLMDILGGGPEIPRFSVSDFQSAQNVTRDDKVLTAKDSEVLTSTKGGEMSSSSPATGELTCTPEIRHPLREGLDKPAENMPLGFSIGIVSAVLSNTGLLTQKLALRSALQQLGSADLVRSYKLWRWWVGFLLFVIGQIVGGFSVAFISVVIMAPFGAINLVVNVFNSYFYLSEPTGVLQIVSSLVLVSGCVVTTIFAPWTKASSTLECFREYVTNKHFHSVAAILLGLFVFVLLCSRLLVLPAQRKIFDQSEWPRSARIGRFLYPVAAGSAAVWTFNVGTALMRLVGEAVEKKEPSGEVIMLSGEVYGLAAFYLLLIVLWQRLMNESMLVLEASYVIPINFGFLTMLSLPFSGALHGTLETWNPDATELAMYFSGIALCLCGMIGLLLSAEARQPSKQQEFSKDAGPSGYKPIPTALSREEAEAMYSRLSRAHVVFSPERISKPALVNLLVQHAQITVTSFESAHNAKPVYSRNSPSTTFTLILEGVLTIESGRDGFMSELITWQLIGTQALVDPSYCPDFTATIPQGTNVTLKPYKGNKSAMHRHQHTKLLQIDRIHYLAATEGAC